jgi:hypothetical protein
MIGSASKAYMRALQCLKLKDVKAVLRSRMARQTVQGHLSVLDLQSGAHAVLPESKPARGMAGPVHQGFKARPAINGTTADNARGVLCSASGLLADTNSDHRSHRV